MQALRFLCKNMSKKIIYPAPERNKSYILEVLKKYFDADKPGTVLEISSGTGQHASYFAQHFPNITFQPSEYDPSLFDSIRAYAADTPTKNVQAPVHIDVTSDPSTWGLPRSEYDYLLNINMIHVSPESATVALFENGTRKLKPGGLMVTYGPYAVNGVITPQSNIDFDKSIRHQNPEWGLRDIRDLKELGEKYGIKLLQIYDMPSNNKTLVWQKVYHKY